MSNKRIKAPKQGNKGLRFSAIDPPDHNKLPPAFSLARLENGKYCFSRLNRDFKAAFAEAIFKRKDLPWQNLNNNNRHGLGFEKIPTNCIKASIPPFITEDKKNLLAFRFSGMNPMVGYRVNEIFYILWFDHDMTLYKHE